MSFSFCPFPQRRLFGFSPGLALGPNLALGITFSILLTPLPSFAQDDFFSTVEVSDDGKQSIDQSFSLIGWAVQKVGYGLEAPGPLFSRQQRELNRVETSLFAQLDVPLPDNSAFRISGRALHDEIYRIKDNDYTYDEVNEFRNRYEIRDFYFEKEFDNGLYFKIGNQILAWGQAEYLRVTDLINIEDQYTFVQQDLEDLRLQIPAALLNFDLGSWSIDAVYTYDADTNNLAPELDEFDPFIAFRSNGTFIIEEVPEREQEVFFRASTQLASGELQFVAGEFNDNLPTLVRLEALGSPNPRLYFSQNRMRALGFSANWVEGSWLFYGEAAIHTGKRVRPNLETFFKKVGGWDEKEQLLSVLGAEYNGFENLQLAMELDLIHTRAHTSSMLLAEDQIGAGVRAFWTPLNQRLQILAVWSELVGSTGRVIRVSADYNWSDTIDFGLLWVDYQTESDSPFVPFENNDVIQLQLRYSFQI
ncbi:MAG: hypothetical protein ISP88_04045 [Pseudomonadales bacterium]|nr:hypothetical protein [Pseudomonadales bacterium]MBL6816474.1 hypothetical protein [Pseudomonadales bacterium]